METPEGLGKVVKCSILEGLVSVLLEDESLINYPLSEITILEKQDPPRQSKQESKQDNS